MYTIQLVRNLEGQYSVPDIQGGKRDFYFSVMGYAVFRNGLLMTPGVDYLIGGTFIAPITPWSEEDIVSALVATR